MKSSISISQIGALLTHFLHRFHVLVFVLTVVGGLSVATFMLNQTLSSNTDIPNSQSTAVFDQKTMERVKKLSKTTSEAKPLEVPAGRTNPFTGS
ncbi:hypothetical protein IPM09_00410 [Candidatus Saccharibacteria bacterium]|nr:MAG: hypothetical protein IPM09_00410 [Candidatus Saccharibacteria bacterium]